MEEVRRPIVDESTKYPPPAEFAAQANISAAEYDRMYQESITHPDLFWSGIARRLHWFQEWTQVLDSSNAPFYKWFVNGKTNLAYNCIDRHLETYRSRTALIFEGEPGEIRTFTYGELHSQVCKFANTLLKIGVHKGDCVALYMPLIPEHVFAVLACARIGAVHNDIFGGFAVDSIKDRVNDSEAKFVITSDGGWRRGRFIPLKATIDAALADCPTVAKVLVVKRDLYRPSEAQWTAGRGLWYHEESQDVSSEHEAEEMEAEDMLFLLYTSGTTGSPKGVMHSTGGYMVGVYASTHYIFDIKASDVYWCTADIGWITGHSYVIYGPLLNAATVLIFEGAPDHPNQGRFWDLIERHRVTVFYTAPTAIRTFIKWGDSWPAAKDLTSLRLLGSVGEPINPEAWLWFHKVIGGERCAIVDTWWQTETGSIMVSPVPGVTHTKPGSATKPFFGIEVEILTEDGEQTDCGFLAIKKPWPSMLRGIYGGSARYVNCYWSKWGGAYYCSNDAAFRDKDGYLWIIGRVDDIVNVSGHNISTAELEGVLNTHKAVAESAVVGVHHEIKGSCLHVFVSLKAICDPSQLIAEELSKLVGNNLGKFELPEKIVFVSDLPKTRSGKIIRRLLRDIAEGRELGNTATLSDLSVVEDIQRAYRAP
jgi:acetyl-CoA synthetase